MTSRLTTVRWAGQSLLRYEPRWRSSAPVCSATEPRFRDACYRDRLYELDGLLQTVLAPRRRGQYATFPSRRHMRQFEQTGFPVEEVARVIGMPLEEAQAHVEKLGLRGVRTSYLLLDRAPGDLDVVADDGVVTMILGLHM